MTTMYPEGYYAELITITEMERRHGPKMHPEFRRRFFPFIASMGGLLGVGGGWRDHQPVKPGAAPEGKSFHQFQKFASGITAYCAVDLVARAPIGRHRAPTWAETDTAPAFGLHTFIGRDTPTKGEPWHIQPIEIRGWQTWTDAGCPDPVPNFPLPGKPEESHSMRIIISHTTVRTAFNEDGTILTDDTYKVLTEHPAFKGETMVVATDHEDFLRAACETNGPAVAFELGKRAERFKTP